MAEPKEPEQQDLPAKTAKAKVCPTCKGELVAHGDANPHKAGAYHCDACGVCWTADLSAQR